VRTVQLLRRLARLLLLNLTVACLPAMAHSSADPIPQAGPPEAIVADSVTRFPVIEGDDLRFKRLSTSDGLSQTRAAQIIQDDQGFIWFGTQYGINRYDGSEFKVFVHDPRNPNSLCGTYVHSLFKDASGMLWIGCNQLVDRFDPRTETFVHYRVDPGAADNQNMTVFHISQDREGLLWLSTNNGLHSLDPRTGASRHFRSTPGRLDGLSTNDIKWTGEDRSGSFWVGDRDGLDEFDRRTGTVLLHLPVPDLLQVSFFEDRAGRFWITQVNGNGLWLFDRSKHVLIPYSFYEHNPPPGNYTGVTGIVEDQNGHLWLGSPGVGLLRFEPENGRFVRYRNRPHDPQSIGEDKVIGLFEDKGGNIWVGLAGVGPNYFIPYPSSFATFKHDPDDPDSLPTNFVNAIYEDSSGTLWLGNDQGLYEYNRRKHRGNLITAGLGANPTVISVVQDLSGTIWFGTFGHGLVSYNPYTRAYSIHRHDPHDSSSLCNDVVHRLFVDHRGTLWVGTEGGLSALEPGSHQFHNFRAPVMAGQMYLTIAEDRAHTLWLGTARSGLQHFDPANGAVTEYKPSPQNPDGLHDNVVQSIVVSRSGSIWIGTQNGLNELDPMTGRFSAYDTGDGMPANFVSCLIEDDRADLWMSTTRGLSRLHTGDHTFFNYSVADGLPGDDFTGWSACSKSSRGELFFGGYPGGVAFFPENVEPTPPIPHVVLTSLEVSGAVVPIGPNQLLHESISYTHRLTLSHEQNTFALQFNAIDYWNPAASRIRYRMGGLDSRWYESHGNIRRASYSALPAGEYDFQIQGARSRGPWTEPGTSLHITILPPWWATWWFRGAYIALAVTALAAIYVARIRQLSRQMTIRMEERLDERSRIARDLHDTLLQGLLSASLQLSIANSQLPTEAKGTSLVIRVGQMLRQMIEESRNAVKGLRIRPRLDEGLEQALAEIPRELGVKDELKFELLVEGERRPLRPAIHDEVYWIARESIANAVRHSNATLVEVELEYSRHRFSMRVRDNGRGIERQILDKGRANHWGLSGMAERATRIRAMLNIESAVGAGTEIALSIPADIAFDSLATRGV
jgi:signal transduction histidine kinase/ligand-binding sensor domain-containing protein